MNCNHEHLRALAEQVGAHCLERQLILTTAESCTGGGVAYYLTEIVGSSAWFERSFVTYSNLAKHALLGVMTQTLHDVGAVSEHVAAQMTAGALANSQANCAIATTGVAGPSGGSAEKPVGTVYIAWQLDQQVPIVERHHFEGDRSMIRRQTIYHCLDKILTF